LNSTAIFDPVMDSIARAANKLPSRRRSNAKYRLGNETETYGEFIFVNNWVNPEQSSNEAWMKTEIMIEATPRTPPNSASFPNGVGDDQFRLREAFVQAGNVLGWQPHAEFWAGNDTTGGSTLTLSISIPWT